LNSVEYVILMNSFAFHFRNMESFKLKSEEEYIELNNLLKILGWVATGGEAKLAIKQGEVIVNSEVDTRVRKKMRTGDSAKFGDEEVKIA